MNKQEITDIVRNQLKEDFPLFKDEHDVHVSFYEGKILIGYRTNSHWNPHGSTHFDIQIEEGICYGLYAEIFPKDLRGKGYGKAMYTAIENIARKLKCSKVIGSFSGTTHDGKEKIENVHKLGYTRISELAAEKVL